MHGEQGTERSTGRGRSSHLALLRPSATQPQGRDRLAVDGSRAVLSTASCPPALVCGCGQLGHLCPWPCDLSLAISLPADRRLS